MMKETDRADVVGCIIDGGEDAKTEMVGTNGTLHTEERNSYHVTNPEIASHGGRYRRAARGSDYVRLSMEYRNATSLTAQSSLC